jgi:hypothetical protein
MTARQLALFLTAAAVILLGAPVAAALLTRRPAAAGPAPVELTQADIDDVITACIRITREAAGGG